jgi:twitching motility protein PilT
MAHYQDELERLVGQLNRSTSREPEGKPLTEGQGAPETLEALLVQAAAESASDVILVAGSPPAFRIHGAVRTVAGARLTNEDVRSLVLPLLNPNEYATLQSERAADLAFDIAELGRFRANVHYQRGTLAATVRLLPRQVPTLASLNLPEQVGRLATLRHGLVLLTGPTGSGKTSTLASIVDAINTARACHIVTIEEPVEYQHVNRHAVIEQIEVGRDTPGFLQSLRSILRQSPDVILVGEMRDPETIATVLTAAETGHLVLSTLHTNDTAQAVSRILDSFPAANQPQIRQQLSLALSAIIAQQLVPSADGKSRWPALEILIGTDAIRNLIRTGNDHQIRSQLTMSRSAGMVTMEHSLAELVRAGRITRESAWAHSYRHDELQRMLS